MCKLIYLRCMHRPYEACTHKKITCHINQVQLFYSKYQKTEVTLHGIQSMNSDPLIITSGATWVDDISPSLNTCSSVGAHRPDR